MKRAARLHICATIAVTALLHLTIAGVGGSSALPAARIDGTEAGWVALGEADFTTVNCHTNT